LTSDTETYRQINNDPTGMLERKLRQLLNDWKSKNKIDQEQFK